MIAAYSEKSPVSVSSKPEAPSTKIVGFRGLGFRGLGFGERPNTYSPITCSTMQAERYPKQPQNPKP